MKNLKTHIVVVTCGSP